MMVKERTFCFLLWNAHEIIITVEVYSKSRFVILRTNTLFLYTLTGTEKIETCSMDEICDDIIKLFIKTITCASKIWFQLAKQNKTNTPSTTKIETPTKKQISKNINKFTITSVIFFNRHKVCPKENDSYCRRSKSNSKICSIADVEVIVYFSDDHFLQGCFAANLDRFWNQRAELIM